MASPTHRSNILRKSRYRFHGLGVLYSGRNMWVTHLFAGRQNPGTRVRTSVC